MSSKIWDSVGTSRIKSWISCSGWAQEQRVRVGQVSLARCRMEQNINSMSRKQNIVWSITRSHQGALHFLTYVEHRMEQNIITPGGTTFSHIYAYMRPHANIIVSGHTSMCVLIPQVYVSTYYHMCPHTTLYCPHTTICVVSSYYYMCPHTSHTTTCVRILPCGCQNKNVC